MDNLEFEGKGEELLLEDLPESTNVQIAHMSEYSGRKYEVNAFSRVCSCDYINSFPASERAVLPHNDLRLVCRHMADALKEINLPPESLLVTDSSSSFGRCILSSPFRHHRYRYHRLEDADMFIGYFLDTTWVNIWLRYDNKDVFKDYSYSLVEDRWRGLGGPRTDAPRGKSSQVKDILNQLFKPIRSGSKELLEKKAIHIFERTLEVEDKIRRYDIQLNHDQLGYKKELETQTDNETREVTQKLIDSAETMLDEAQAELKNLQGQLARMEEMMAEGHEYVPAKVSWNVIDKSF